MLVISNRGSQGLGTTEMISAYSRTMACPGAAQSVENFYDMASGTRMQISPTGTGAIDTSSVPKWAWWLGGGLVAGLLAGAVYFKVRK